MIFWRGEGSRRAGAGLRFAEEWAAEEILDQVGGRLAAGVALCKALGARLPGGAFLLLVCVVAGFAPCRVAIPMG